MDEDQNTSVAGWYGKIPSLGDFASRRLPAPFIEVWDDWLQRSLTASHAILGDSWMQTYLTSPIWRFALMPSVCGSAGWIGIMMPSVDKVGRYFPLTLSLPIDPRGEIPGASAVAQVWYAQLETIAMRALDLAYSVDDLERELAEHPYPQATVAETAGSGPPEELVKWWTAPSGPPQTFDLPEMARIADAIQLSLDGAMRAAAARKSLWWSAPPIGEYVLLHCCEGLPDADYFSVLLQGGSASAAPLATPTDPVA